MSRLVVLLAGLWAVPLGAQTVSMDGSALATGPAATMATLLEKTIFKVDVLTLEIRWGEDTAERLAPFIGSTRDLDRVADSVAAVALESRDLLARLEFLRDVSRDRFLGELRNSARKGYEAGIITSEAYELIERESDGWYAFLTDRGILEGDEMLYRIRGDTLRTVFRTRNGEVLLDQTDIGPERPLSVLGGYFAPGSDFRKGLVRSLVEPGARPMSPSRP